VTAVIVILYDASDRMLAERHAAFSLEKHEVIPCIMMASGVCLNASSLGTSIRGAFCSTAVALAVQSDRCVPLHSKPSRLLAGSDTGEHVKGLGCLEAPLPFASSITTGQGFTVYVQAVVLLI
jgi:hypothetical protein